MSPMDAYDVVDLGANSPRRFAVVRHPADPRGELVRSNLKEAEAARTADRLNHDEAKRRARTARRRRNRQLTEDEQRKRRQALLRSQQP